MEIAQKGTGFRTVVRVHTSMDARTNPYHLKGECMVQNEDHASRRNPDGSGGSSAWATHAHRPPAAPGAIQAGPSWEGGTLG